MSRKNEYANALFMLACEDGAVETVKEDTGKAALAFTENPDYIKLLDTPALTKEEKLSLIDKAFAPLHYSVTNLIKILCEKHLVHSFKNVASAFLSLYDDYSGIERAEAVTAVEMTEAQKNAISKKLAEMTGKRIILKNTVDPKILGGVMLRYSGVQLDGSVKSRLDSFALSLKNLNL